MKKGKVYGKNLRRFVGDALLLELMKDFLTKEEYDLCCQANYKLYDTEVLSDGFEVLHWIKEHGSFSNIDY